MEQENQENQENNSSYETVDFSNILEENEENAVVQDEEEAKEEKLKNVPKVYRMIIKLSFGLVKTEKEAKMVAILIIIITNVITLSLLLKDKSANDTFQGEVIPAEANLDNI